MSFRGGRGTLAGTDVPAIMSSDRFHVTRAQIASRGLRNRCPNCGVGTLFETGTAFLLRPACPHCGMRWDKDEGAFLGSVTLNYGVTVFGLVLPWVVYAVHADFDTTWIIALTAVIALLVPVALYRPSKGWWFACYYLVLPYHLPANWSLRPELDRPPDE